MMGVPKVMIFFAVLISSVLYWATSNVCKYNFALEKKTRQLNIITENIDPTLGNAKYYVYRELNCNDVYLEWDYERVIENLSSIIILPNLKYNNILTESNKSEAKNKVELTYDKFPKEFVIPLFESPCILQDPIK